MIHLKSYISSAAFVLYNCLPARFRSALKSLVGVNGHVATRLDFLRSTRDATGKKRLDRALRRICDALKRSNIGSVENKECLELGCGFVPSESLCMLLLGARQVIATDINRIADIEALRIAYESADVNSLVDLLKASGVEELVAKRRLEDLGLAILGGWEALETLGFVYKAPVFLEDELYGRGSFDFVYSVSVLEHIRPSEIVNFLGRVLDSINNKGVWFNEIDLRDHHDFDKPQGFLYDKTYDAELNADIRGNRLRLDDWLLLFAKLSSSKTEFVSEILGRNLIDHSRLDPRLHKKSEHSLMCQNVLVVTSKTNA